MTIDETISELEILKKCTYSYMSANQAFTTAIETMRKYQKIEQIMEDYQRYPMDCLFNVREVLEDGKID
jgi:hypothetical protein